MTTQFEAIADRRNQRAEDQVEDQKKAKSKSKSKEKKEKPVDLNLTVDDMNKKKKKKKKDKDSASEKSDKKNKKKKKNGESSEKGSKAGGPVINMNALVGESERGTTNEDPHGGAQQNQDYGTPGEWQPLPEEQASDPGNAGGGPG
jgi:hypothetical protein